MTEFVFAAPLWILLVALGGGVALAAFGLFRGDRTVRTVGIVVLLVAAIWAVASHLVETGSERTTRRSRELVDAVEKMDWDAVATYLEPGVTLSLPKRGVVYDDRGQLLAAARLVTLLKKVPALSVGTVDAAVQGDLVTTTVQVKASNDQTAGYANPSVWRFVWQRGKDEWMVREIEGIDMGPIGAGVEAYFPKAGG